MRIELKKFGDILVSRPAGREAYLAMSAYVIHELKKDESILIDFNGVKVLAPSWADEVLTKLAEHHLLEAEHTENSTIQSTLETLMKYSGLQIVIHS